MAGGFASVQRPYRAALDWAEEVTNVSTTHASDEAYAAAAAAFEAKDLVDLTIAIAAMNAFNRLGAPFRLPVAAKPSRHDLDRSRQGALNDRRSESEWSGEAAQFSRAPCFLF